LGFNTPPLGAGVPPHTLRFQGEIFTTPQLAAGILYLNIAQNIILMQDAFQKNY
jgi:hypothetical protein